MNYLELGQFEPNDNIIGDFFSDKMFLIRYEDLSLEPFATTDRLLQFLDLKPNKLIDQFLESHTKTKRPGIFWEEG